jgi:hypothetical protein
MHFNGSHRHTYSSGFINLQKLHELTSGARFEGRDRLYQTDLAWRRRLVIGKS